MYKSCKHIIFLAFIFCSLHLFGQSQKEIKKKKDAAKSYFSVGNYEKAYPILDELHQAFPSNYDITFMLGYCEMNYKKNYAVAINYFEAIKINASIKDIPRGLYRLLGEAYHVNYNFINSVKNYNKYLTLVPEDETELIESINRKIKASEYANELYTDPKEYKKVNLGDNINSNKGDYGPVISADETTLMFTSRRTGGISSKTTVDGDPYEDIYISTKDPNNKWGKAKLMSKKINTSGHDATSATTADGQKLFIYRSGENEVGGIYESLFDNDEWELPVLMGKNINSKNRVTSVSITPDEQALYFTCNKKTGIGGKDIYVSHKLDDGTWGVAKNLGSEVNTIYDEESPFIHPDGKTLFFSSKGHDNMGGYDIFKTYFDGTSWSAPENLGYPLNSTKDDLHFVLSANGKNGYYTSASIDGYGKEDIYQIVMSKMNIPLTMIRGTILCADSLKPIDVIIKVRDVETGEFIKHVYKPNSLSGKYLIILPPGKNYDMIITTDGYIPYKMNVHIPEQKEFYELYQTIYIKAINPFNKKLGQGISVDNSFFDTSGILVDTEEQQRIEKLRQERLQELLNSIINQSDSLSMNNLNDTVASNFETTNKTLVIDTNFSSLLNLVGQIFENTDSTALKHTNNIIERGFYTYAERNIHFYGNELRDTITVNTNSFKAVQPINYVDTINSFGIIEKTETESNDSNKVEIPEELLSNVILFENKELHIQKEHLKDIDQLIVVYKNYPYLKFIVTGHTDNIGSKESNLMLSKKRVQLIESYLMKNGVAPSNIKIHWKGEEFPVASNETEAGRAQNRRVEIKLIKKE